MRRFDRRRDRTLACIPSGPAGRCSKRHSCADDDRARRIADQDQSGADDGKVAHLPHRNHFRRDQQSGERRDTGVDRRRSSAFEVLFEACSRAAVS